MHFLFHLSDMVKLYGPLPIQAAYFTENTMGLISKRVKTGTNVTQQVMRKCLTYQSVVSTCNNKNINFSQLFLKNLNSYLPKLSPIDFNVNSLALEYIPKADELALFGTVGDNETFSLLQRVCCKGQIICTIDYNQTKAKLTNNHCIKTEKNRYYVIEKIMRANQSGRICLLGCEFLNCKKLLLYPKDPFATNIHFSHILTFSHKNNLR